MDISKIAAKKWKDMSAALAEKITAARINLEDVEIKRQGSDRIVLEAKTVQTAFDVQKGHLLITGVDGEVRAHEVARLEVVVKNWYSSQE